MSLESFNLRFQDIYSFKHIYAGAIFAFHTEKKSVLLGSLRQNPTLPSHHPKQIDLIIRERVIEKTDSVEKLLALRTVHRLLGDSPLYHVSSKIAQLVKAIAQVEGWSEPICEPFEKEDIYLTAVKHISCTESDLEEIEKELKELRSCQRIHNPSLTLPEYHFIEVDTIETTPILHDQVVAELIKINAFTTENRAQLR